MGTKVRKQIYIEAEQDAVLKRMSQATGLSEAEIIRQAIDRHAQAQGYPRPDIEAWNKELDFILKRQAQGPVHGGRTWRREDLYDRKILR